MKFLFLRKYGRKNTTKNKKQRDFQDKRPAGPRKAAPGGSLRTGAGAARETGNGPKAVPRKPGARAGRRYLRNFLTSASRCSV